MNNLEKSPQWRIPDLPGDQQARVILAVRACPWVRGSQGVLVARGVQEVPVKKQ